jgi:hypothetical protein
MAEQRELVPSEMSSQIECMHRPRFVRALTALRCGRLSVSALIEDHKATSAARKGCNPGTRKLAESVVRAGILFRSGRSLPRLPAILRSHALIHTAEGEFFREVLLAVSAHCA